MEVVFQNKQAFPGGKGQLYLIERWYVPYQEIENGKKNISVPNENTALDRN